MRVYITPQVHAEIMYYVNKSHIEISGLGRIQKTTNGDMVVTKIYLLKQENAAASTDICEEAVAQMLFETREDKGDLNFWWHSHVDMNTFWSGTDMATIKQFGKKGYLLSTVFNKKGEHRTSYFQGATDFLPELFIDDLKTQFGYLPTKAEHDGWEKQYLEKCSAKTWHHNTSGMCGGTSGRWDHTKYSNASGIGENAPAVTRWVNGKKLFAGMSCAGLSKYEMDVLEELEKIQPKQLELTKGGGSDASTPSGKEYQGGGFTTQPVGGEASENSELSLIIGDYSGSTARELIDWMYAAHHNGKTYEDLNAEDYAILYDIHLTIFEGEQPEDTELQWLLTDITKNWAACMEYEYDILHYETNKRLDDEEDEVVDEEETV